MTPVLKTLGTSPSDILDGIHLVRVATQVQMVAFLNLLDEWLGDHPNVSFLEPNELPAVSHGQAE